MWSKILGHTQQIERLKKALNEGKVPHAYLFTGIEGIGKKQVALGLAQALNETSKTFHPDCTLIEPTGKNIRVEVLRDLKQKAYLHPLEGKAKIFIIDQAEKMTLAGANALLKILEEPPQQTYLILITSQPSLLLATIRSRCQRIEFYPLPQETIFKILKAQGKEEVEAKQLSLLSQGSVTQALTFDATLYEEVKIKWESLWQNPKPTDLLKLSESLSDEEEKLSFIFQTFSSLTYEKLKQTEDRTELSLWTNRWLSIQSAQNRLETYANKRLLVESLLFRLSQP